MIKKIKLEDKEVIIIGTAHVSKKNADQVKQVILEEEPDIVGIEIDRSRLGKLLNNKEEKNSLKDIFRSKKPFLFLTMYFLSKFQKNIAKKLNTTAGAEMKIAIKSAKEINSKILLLDRDINITVNKLWKNITFFEKLKFIFGGLFLSKEEKNKVKKLNINSLLNEVENDTDSSKTIEMIMKIFSKKFKKLKRILIDERDQFMAYNIKHIECEKIVVVVGAGHVEGIIKNLKSKKKINVNKLLSLNLT